MCAIFGVLGKLPTKEKFIYARDTMTHRGPNDAGLYWDEKARVALGHRRLSIIDLSEAGRQPLFSNDGQFSVVFNGEIYNYLELRRELGKNYDFKTKTDTEVLLAAYSVWGEKCLEKLNGMFAFAIWDKKEEKLFCARDRLGIKPFFYFTQGDTLYFASEIKALLALGIEREPNEHVIFQYLYYGFYDHSEETFFKGVKNLPGGSFFVWKDGKFSISRFWDLADKEKDYSLLSEEKVHEKFEELLTDSIRLRFRSDVPVGISLSSGLDSNILLFYSTEVLKAKNIHLFSRCFRSEAYNECSLLDTYLREEQKRMWHKSYFTPEDALPLIYELNRVEDQPYGGFLTIGGYHLHKQTASLFAPVILEGQGLDEILGGYKYYRMELEKDASRGKNDASKNKGNRPSFSEYSQDTTALIDKNILNKKFISIYSEVPLSFHAPFESHLLNAQYQDLIYTKLPRVLRFNDHVSMSHARELRMPYLDYRIVEFCFFLPAQYKIKGDERKVLAREVAKKYVPPAVYSKQKKAYGAVQVEWLRRHYQKEVFSIIESPSFKSRKYWDHGALRKRVENFYGGEGENSFFLWQCINLELWFREFIDK